MKQRNIGTATKAGLLFVSSSLLLSTAVSSVSAHESPKREGFNEPFILSHLKQLKVVVGNLDAYATDNGESQAHLKQLLTERLAPTHITVAEGDVDAGKGANSSSKDCGPADTPLLYLKVKVIPDGGASKGAACSVNLALVEKAKIARNKKDLMVSVWTSENVGRISDNAKEAIDQQIESAFKDFHRDYNLANSADSSKDVPEETHGKAAKKPKLPTR